MSDMVTGNPALLTIQEAARHLSVSRSTIYRLIAEKALTVVRPTPDSPRIRRADLQAYTEAL